MRHIVKSTDYEQLGADKDHEKMCPKQVEQFRHLLVCNFMRKNQIRIFIRFRLNCSSGFRDRVVGCFVFNGPSRQYFSLYRAVSQKRGRKRRERIDESKMSKPTPTGTYCMCSRPSETEQPQITSLRIS